MRVQSKSWRDDNRAHVSHQFYVSVLKDNRCYPRIKVKCPENQLRWIKTILEVEPTLTTAPGIGTIAFLFLIVRIFHSYNRLLFLHLKATRFCCKEFQEFLLFTVVYSTDQSFLRISIYFQFIISVIVKMTNIETSSVMVQNKQMPVFYWLTIIVSTWRRHFSAIC